MGSKRPNPSLIFFLTTFGAVALWIWAGKALTPGKPSEGTLQTSDIKRTVPDFPEPGDTVIDESASPERKALLKMLKATDYKTHAEWRRERDDRRELVRAAPPGFKPRIKGRKLEIKLIPKAEMLSKGKLFEYRLEIRNIGDEEETFNGDGFLRDATQPYTKFTFYITPPGGAEFRVMMGTKEELACAGFVGEKHGVYLEDFKNGLDCGHHTGYGTLVEMPEGPEMAGMNPAQKKQAFIEQEYRRRVKGRVHVRLLPGEMLTAPAWVCAAPSRQRARGGRGQPPPPPVSNGFRELCTPYRFDVPGTYRIRVVYDDPPGKPPSEFVITGMAQKGVSREQLMEDHQFSRRFHLGTLESNTVLVERLP